ncbi:alpha/beta fold hydrolase [Actinocrispum wychmicini]|uniref:Alpha-beta hydrolase superfamily lysophospholipase n=1 Tax=Actinocrispum wychmicini TaxID=1213861 RepID=A0A4V2S3E9_9PSEU|nr:alpha/beta fold hydrolase [Actinocrispum wychmicini]TCO44180.1 alpha-beta hydrolase superfamily lysophospholipase [Actinocrispum wychmicini]
MPEFAGTAGTVHHRSWVPADPRVLVVLLHGLGEHVGLYEPFAAALNDAGIAVWALDHAGHGRSDGVRVLINSVDTLLDDAGTLIDLARAAHPELPFVLIGHSLGSTLTVLLVGERKVPASALVLAGSSLVPSGESALVALLATGIDPMDIRKDPSEMTRNEAYAQQIRDDPLTWQGGIRLETLQALGTAAGRVAAVIESVTVPTLLVHGAEDDLAPAAGAERAAELLPNGKAVIFPNDLHNILNEIDRDEVYRVVIEFVRTVS